MRRLVVVVGLAVLAGCTSPVAPEGKNVTGPCWVTTAIPHADGYAMSLHYQTCPTKAALDSTLGPGNWSVRPG